MYIRSSLFCLVLLFKQASIVTSQRGVRTPGEAGAQSLSESTVEDETRQLGEYEGGRDTFVSSFRVIFSVRDEVFLNPDAKLNRILRNVASALPGVYNNLVQGYPNPNDIRMDEASVLMSDFTEYEHGHDDEDEYPQRGLTFHQFIFGDILAPGSCSFCEQDQTYTDQIIPIGGGDGDGGDGGDGNGNANDEGEGGNGNANGEGEGRRLRQLGVGRPNGSPTQAPASNPSEDPVEPPIDSPDDGTLLPTEEDLLDAYSAYIAGMDDPNIADAVFLEEVAIIPGLTKSGKKGKGAKKGGKGGSKESGKGGGKGGSKGSKLSEGGKGGKGGDKGDKKSKGDKGGKGGKGVKKGKY